MTNLVPCYPESPGSQPEYRVEAYVATRTRSPQQALIRIPQSITELTGPQFGREFIAAHDNDLTCHGLAAPIGQRIVVSGRVLDENAEPVRNTLIELWQANAAGRYRHKRDQWDAPLDPNFKGEGRTLTDDDGRYKFLTIRPGAYPWKNHYNAWRPAHIHFSLFGNAYAERLVTQMYFPGDELLPHDPIFNSIPDIAARQRLIACHDWDTTQPSFVLGYRFDIVLRGRDSTPMK